MFEPNSRNAAIIDVCIQNFGSLKIEDKSFFDSQSSESANEDTVD